MYFEQHAVYKAANEHECNRVKTTVFTLTRVYILAKAKIKSSIPLFCQSNKKRAKKQLNRITSSDRFPQVTS